MDLNTIFTTPIEQSSVLGLGMRLVIAIAVLIVGLVIAKLLQNLVKSTLEKIRQSKMLRNSPVSIYTKDEDSAASIENFAGELIFWLAMLLVFDAAANVAGIMWLTGLFDKLFAFVPRLISASIILVFGVLLAGLAESLIKNAIRPIDQRLGRMSGKLSGYLVMVLAVLIAVSELGIAQEYILILFIGLVITVSMAVGLATGLGGQYFVREVLDRWQKRWQDRAKQDS